MSQTLEALAANLAAPMTMERAHEINAACCQTAFARLVDNKLIPLPTEYTLEEMLVASRLVETSPGQKNDNGTTTHTMHVDPRGLALHYAYDHFGKSPLGLLGALNFHIDEESVGFCQGCATFIALNLLEQFQQYNVCQSCKQLLQELDEEQRQ